LETQYHNLNPVSCEDSGRTGSGHTQSGHSYQIFIPGDIANSIDRPLLVVIDPDGDGEKAVQNFIRTASLFRMVLVGSNLIRNGNPHYLREINELIADVKDRFQVGDALFIAGFSGGARMALSYAQFRPVTGILACGAFVPSGLLERIKTRVFCIMGRDDFNFQEVAPFVTDPSLLPSHIAIDITREPHRWPSRELLHSSVEFLLLASGNTLPTYDLAATYAYISAQRKLVELCTLGNDLKRAALICRNMSGVEAFDQDGFFNNFFNQLIQDENYGLQTVLLSDSLSMEEVKIREYSHALFYKDAVWWRKELDGLQEKTDRAKDEWMKMAYRRIKARIGVACHAVCVRYEKEKDAGKLGMFLDIYRLVEPQE